MQGLQARYNRNEEAHQKYVKKMSKKLVNAAIKADDIETDKKVLKIKDRMNKNLVNYETGKKALEREMKTIKDYSLADFEKEKNFKKKAIAKSAVNSALGTMASVAITAVTMGTVPAFYYFQIPNMTAQTTMYREEVAQKKQKYGANISDKAAKAYEKGDKEKYKKLREKEKRKWGE